MQPNEYFRRQSRAERVLWAIILTIAWSLILYGISHAYERKAWYYELTPRAGGQSCLVGPFNRLAVCRDNLGSAFYSHNYACHISGPVGGNCRNLDSGYAYPKGAGLKPAWQIPDTDCSLLPLIHTHEYGKWVRFWYSDVGDCTVVIKGQPKPVLPSGSFTYYADKQCPGWPWIYIGDAGGPGGDGVCG